MDFEELREVLLDGAEDMCRFNDMVRCESHCEGGRDCDNCPKFPIPENMPNGKNKPKRIKWKKYGELGWCSFCPSCRNEIMEFDFCTHCGQRFVQDRKTVKMRTPVPKTMNCPFCGGHHTLHGMIAPRNGHFHGSCEKCGIKIMQ